MTENYSSLKEILVYRRVERDGFSLKVLLLQYEEEINELEYHFATFNESIDLITDGC